MRRLQERPALEGMTFGEALGMTVNQHLFASRMTRTELGRRLGITQSVMSRKVLGRTTWTAEELAELAQIFGVGIENLVPARADDGWEPAAYVAGRGARVEGAQAAPAAVPPVGLEPTTFGLKVRSSDQLS